jgi:hypothetical protein
MDWVFFATKPSFMNALTTWDRMQILALSPLPLIVASGVGCGAFWLASRLSGARPRPALLAIGLFWPGLVLASSFLLLLDNFTYTLFRVGIQKSTGAWRYGYIVVFVLFWLWGWRLSMKTLRWLSEHGNARLFAPLLVGLLTVAWCVFLPAGARQAGILSAEDREPGKSRLPNILLLGWDGVSAEDLSLYGSERETTPFLRSFAKQGLVCENAFANAQNSSSSIVSMLTGKAPTTLRLNYSPEILTGRNAYEHLPGILRQYGYKTVDIGIRQITDAYDLNMLSSFEQSTTRKETENPWRASVSAWLGMGTGYFLGSSWERLCDRLLHMTGAKDSVSGYEVVTGQPLGGWSHDGQKIEQLLEVIASPDRRPFFVHAHLLGTHWPVGVPKHRVFSEGRERKDEFEIDFYDDAILEMDASFSRIVDALRTAGQLNNTILVFSSDHSKQWGQWRVPLVFWFPKGDHRGRIRTNAQNLDIAPTLLDYAGIAKPEWMRGTSLLRGQPPKQRPIFFTAVNNRLVNTKKWLLEASQLKPPFYSLGAIGMRVGDRTYELDLPSWEMTTDFVHGHTYPLGEGEVPTVHQAWTTLVNHLEENGYKIPESLKRRVTLHRAG